MIQRFRIELAKLFAVIIALIVLIFGLVSQLTLKVLLFRMLIGAVIFGICGFLIGWFLDQEREKLDIEDQKKILKSQLRQDYENAKKKKPKDKDIEEEDFIPMDTDELTKLVVNALDE